MEDQWTEDELRAAVKAYVDMRQKEAKGQSFVKKQYYRELAQQFARTEKSFEYRMQNISHIYDLMGRSWVRGLKPAKNVGEINAESIERLISEVEGQENAKVAKFETQVAKYRSQKSLGQPAGVKSPKQIYATSTSFDRDPKVKAWVLQAADGHCECCDAPAPFQTAAGDPFLEVHHLYRLADGGSDTTTNAVAVCPNCHRELHYGADRASVADSIYAKVSRLIRE